MGSAIKSFFVKTIRKVNRFFTRHSSSEKFLSDLTHIMVETIDLDRMTNRILNLLTRTMRISKAAFLLTDEHRVVGIRGIGYHDHTTSLETLFHYKEGRYQYVLFEELADRSVLKELFRALDITLAIPVRVESHEVAILILGPKLSGARYSQRDIDMLIIFASEAGIAIQNARTFTAMKEFSKELERRVEKRTRELKETQERELAKANEVARLKDEFVFLAAHELRTPVFAIKGFLELVSEASSSFPKDIKEHLDAIGLASTNLNQLVGDLLEVARSEAGTMKVAVRAIALPPIIDSSLKEISPLAHERGVTMRMETHGTVPKVLADARRIKEVVYNLLSNAIKYNRAGGTVDIDVFLQGGSVIAEFRDTGYGIPKEKQSKIFQKFFRAGTKGTQEVIGTGLGLFIARMLMEKMGGNILFTSVEGKGSTFAFSLPVSKV